MLVRRFLEKNGADSLIAVIDATKLERNLYLLTQIAEYALPMIVVVNMIDDAERQGRVIDTDRLGSIFGIEALPAAAVQGKNIDRILPLALRSSRSPFTPYSLRSPYRGGIPQP